MAPIVESFSRWIHDNHIPRRTLQQLNWNHFAILQREHTSASAFEESLFEHYYFQVMA